MKSTLYLPQILYVTEKLNILDGLIEEQKTNLFFCFEVELNRKEII